MKQHELDPVSLFFGLVFVFVAGGYLLTHTTDVQLHWLLALPAVLIALGIAILGATARRMQRADPDPEL
jgi:ABC-type antimicrobial peptide transport system permease subunit